MANKMKTGGSLRRPHLHFFCSLDGLLSQTVLSFNGFTPDSSLGASVYFASVSVLTLRTDGLPTLMSRDATPPPALTQDFYALNFYDITLLPLIRYPKHFLSETENIPFYISSPWTDPVRPRLSEPDSQGETAQSEFVSTQKRLSSSPSTSAEQTALNTKVQRLLQKNVRVKRGTLHT